MSKDNVTMCFLMAKSEKGNEFINTVKHSVWRKTFTTRWCHVAFMCLAWYIHHLFCLKKRFGELLVDVINRVRLFCCREFGFKITAFQI